MSITRLGSVFLISCLAACGSPEAIAHKSNNGLALHHQTNPNQALGIPFSTELKIEHRFSDGDIEVELNLPSAISLVSGKTVEVFSVTEPGAVTLPLTLISEADGFHVIAVMAKWTGEDGKKRMRAFSVPISTGEVARDDAEKLSSITEGGYVNLPVQETTERK